MPKFSKEFKLAVLAVFIALFSFVFIKGDLGFLKSGQYSELQVSGQAAQNESGAKPEALTAKDELAKTENPEFEKGPIKEEADKTVQSANQKDEKKLEGGVAGVKESPKDAGDVINAEGGISAGEKPNAEENAKPANLYSVDFYVNNEKFETFALPQSTVYDLMASLKNQGKIIFSGENYSGLGFFVKEINGVKNNPKTGEFWLYYINNKPAWVGVSGYELKPGDVISWKYIKEM